MFSPPLPPKPSFSDRFIGSIERHAPSDKLLLRFFLLSFVISLIVLGFELNERYVAITPTTGGEIIEGVIGTPRFVNPVLAITRADQDMTALIYSGLMKIGPTGALEHDIAERITISEDGRTYNVELRRDLRFHDGTPVTARDVSYTIALIQNPDLKSPLRGNWNGVQIEELDEYELNIVLEEPYAPFIENLTVGILPRHIWDELPIEQLPFSQHNAEPIGSGPFMIETAIRNQSGLVDQYILRAFENARSTPRLQQIEVHFFSNETALENAFLAREISATAYLPTETVANLSEDEYQIIEGPLPRVFGIFFNQNRSAALRDQGAREALSLAIDRKRLVDEVLLGYGLPISDPVPPGFLGVESENLSTTTSTREPLSAARARLTEAGWSEDEVGSWVKDIDGEEVTLGVTLRTANTDLFDAATTFVATAWRELGVEVRTEQFEQADLLQAVIRPRDFEALFYGIDMSRAVDLYPFWHSSQQDDPGLNIALYANIDVDALLSDALTEQDSTLRTEALIEGARIISDEVPAIFLFTPTMHYVLSPDVNLASIKTISRPHERFMNVEHWHANTERLWPVFQNSELNLDTTN